MKLLNLLNQVKQLFFVTTICLLFTACDQGGDEDSAPKVNPITLQSIAALDISNDISSEDIQVKVSFDKVVDEIRIVIVPSSDKSSATDEQLLDLDSKRYMTVVSAFKTDFNFRLENILDINGNEIINSKEYSIGVIYSKGDVSYVSEKFADLTLTNKNPLLGNYVGLWNDNLYTDFGISFRLENEGANSLSGGFFYTSNFQSCCGGPINDGTITLTFSEETPDEIGTFVYNQDLLNFMGGCTGLYTGSGTFQTLSLSIDYTGDDCEGPHTSGRIKVDRDF